MSQQRPVATLHLYERDVPIYDFSMFAEISAESINRVYSAFTQDPIITTASSIALNDLMGGGIVFERQGKTLEESARRFYNDCYSRFLEQLVKSLWMFGFAACVIEPHEKYIGIPRVLDLRQIRVMVFEDVTGTRHYAIFRRPFFGPMMTKSETFPINALGEEKLMEGISIFEMDAPDGQGNLRSKIVALLPELDYQRLLQSCHLEATRLACNPVVIEERPENRYDPENLTFSVVPAESLGEVDALANSKVTHLTRAEMEYRSEAARIAYERSRATFAYDSHLEANTAAEIGMKTLKLAKNSKLARQNAPQDLSLVLENRAMCEELVAAAFGVPRSMFAQSTYSKAIKNEDAITMFQRSQMRLKLLLQTFLHRMYNAIYGRHHLFEAIAQEILENGDDSEDDDDDDDDTEKKDDAKRSDNDDDREEEDDQMKRKKKDKEAKRKRIEDEADVQITICSIPATTTLTTLYYEGTLSYNAYVDMVSMSYGIPHEFFNRTPGLTLQELNGIKEDNKDISVSDNGEHMQKVTEVEKKSRSATGQVSVTKSRSIETSDPVALGTTAADKNKNKKKTTKSGSANATKKRKR